MNKRQLLYLCIVFALVFSLACSLPSLMNTPAPQASSTVFVPTLAQEEISENSTPAPEVTSGIPITSNMKPADTAPEPEELIYDVESSGTGHEGRAPYGDSYKLNRFERPFLNDMTYVSDMDIDRFSLSQDADWYYISIELVGNDPNNPLGINYGVEIDLDADGFGDYIIWAHPPYATEWDTSTVQVFMDSDRDSAGLSSSQSDAIFDGNGYETLIFDGGSSQAADPGLAWVRVNGDQHATIQFAFKRSFTGPFFLFGVVSDAGLKDLSKFDYSDRFTEADAGSSVRDNMYYPLGLLYAIDNTCWEANGISATGSAKLCSPILQPTRTPSHNSSDEMMSTPSSCFPAPTCPHDPVTCVCN